ncbi:MAG TPA: hypothetical protein VKZ53_22745 [Candidatus Angelobacter sp.]|nr:hypothetical protein [Candidatus Angelobacter sp.]
MRSNKFPVGSTIITFVLAMVLSLSAFAAGDIHKGNLQIGDPVLVSGKELPAGSYVVKWEGEGPTVDVTILQGKKTVLTAQAQVVNLDQKSSNDAAELKSGSNGSRSLTSLQFAGKKFALSFGAQTNAQSGN